MLHQKFKRYPEKIGVLNQQINRRTFLFFLIAAIALCFFIYLWQVNSMATKGYKIKDLEGRMSDLKDQNKKLELQVAELRSTARISEKLKELNLVEVAKIEYLTSSGTSVAINR